MKIYIALAAFFVSTSCTTVERSVDRFPSSVSIDITKLQNKLKPFSSNGCSKFSSGISYPKVEKWGLCCVQHDISYWKGGTNDDRYQADQRLQNCIIEVGEPNIARLVYWGVRAGNNDNTNMSSSWGFGWVLNRGYSPFSAEEKIQIEALEKQIPTDLTKVNISKDDGTKDKETLTGDYCLDSSVMFIQRNLSRKMTPLTASEQNTEVAGAFEYSVSIMTKECHKPYVFIYSLSKKDSCTRKSTEQNYRQEVSLKDIVYPEECL